jgi:hypothetical protein
MYRHLQHCVDHLLRAVAAREQQGSRLGHKLVLAGLPGLRLA